MLLEGKTAVVYVGGGKVGGAVARAFASEPSTMALSSQPLWTLSARRCASSS